MTNSEYFEKNKISFAESMEIFNEQKNKKGGTKSFDKFLASEHFEHKFKVGDLIVLLLNKNTRSCGWKHNIVFEVIGIDCVTNSYDAKLLTPNGSAGSCIGTVQKFFVAFIDKNCFLY